MFDGPLRRRLSPRLDGVAARLDAAGVGPMAVTGIGLVVGLGAAVAAGLAWWWVALGLWLLNRMLDGLDGAVARRRGPSDLGGYLDLVADFVVYAAFVVGVAVAVPAARLPAVCALAAYYVNAAALLAWSSLQERARNRPGDGRSLHLTRGLVEGAETIVAYALICLVPSLAGWILGVFAVLVAATAVQRVVQAARLLRPTRS